MRFGLRRIRGLWRHLLRLERPRQALVAWRPGGGLLVLLLCLLVALLSSWPWLVEPNLRPGMPAPFTARAPSDATVIDSTDLEQRRSQMLPRSQIQVVDPQASEALVQQLELRLQRVRQTVADDQPRPDSLNLTEEERRWLTGLTPPDLMRWKVSLRRAQQRMLSQGVVASLSEGQLLTAAELQLQDLSPPARSLGSRLLAASLQGRTNLRGDSFLSQRRIEDLLTRQGLPTIRVRKNDLITRQGEPISPQAFDVLEHFDLVNHRPRPLAWLGRFSEALAACGVLLLVMRRWRASLEPRQALLALAMLVLVQGCKLWLGSQVSPLALLVPPTLLLSQGLGTAAGLAWLAVAAMLWPVPVEGLLVPQLGVAALVAAIAAVLAGRQRNRAQLLQLALLLPIGAVLLQWLLIQLFHLGSLEASQGLFSSTDLLQEALLVAGLLMGGLLLAPLVESFFGLLTRARLMELADLERPLLRRLSMEAPGTFEHTLMICGLAEEGARAIQGDVDLIRTGALYHDVGKLHGPQWFIENQEHGANPHDELDDPFASAAILQAHVDEGLKLARRYRLPRPLADFIPEHQGRLKMGYFLHQAKERDPSVREEQFRYRGPAPRSRETAILMLADGCEAALRSLPPGTTEAEARAMVRRLVEARQNDGQLDGSGISRAELELVIRAFVRVWKRMRHRRIPYPIPPRKAFSA
ncbi:MULTISPECIES: HDIG domain-containing metalloprotein [unclassified Synechococcus]|uniref:HDIG domain-containing metalloprotein n=1 Tax=unclassified Synechococcus TaxID=2626047 RepID=UPI000B9821FB|nr:MULTISPECIES: HDIG domain-containing metalloprotein [unclassified Synechococcus]MBD2717358.1 HDIG domain-containing protein [Synechococcus sp. FACHB-909]